MKAISFNSARNMLYIITSGQDLYSPDLEEYVFVYNDLGSICFYRDISIEKAHELEIRSKSSGEYWGAFLGSGGCIIDSDKNTDVPWERDTPIGYLSAPPLLDFYGPIEKMKPRWKHKWLTCGPEKVNE